MTSKLNENNIEKILSVSKQIAILIEDNNQNMRDCHRALVELQKIINPKRPSWIKRKICKLINRKE